MKTTISGLVLGAAMALTLAACNTTPMNGNDAMGASSAGATGTSTNAEGVGRNMRGAAPINCTTNANTDGTSAADTPGTRCPSESH